MDMQVAALDILTTKGGFSPAAARAIGEAMDLQIARSYQDLATNQRLDETRLRLEGVFDTLEQGVRLQIAEAKAQFWHWMIWLMMGQTAAVAGLLRLFMPHGP